MSTAIKPIKSAVESPIKITRKQIRLEIGGRVFTGAEFRYYVDLYYQLQEYRKAGGNQEKAAIRQNEPPGDFAKQIHGELRKLEMGIQVYLDEATDLLPVARWAKSIAGIGPVIAAGLMAHIDIERAPTVGHIWRFAGLDPTLKWEKKTKRPWNAALKVLCWKIGESFVKVSGNAADIYGQVYLTRKEQETARNAAGEYADQAKAILEQRKIGKDTEAYGHYSGGKLPPAQIHARAKRYAVKLFLSHYHHVAYLDRYGCEPPKPYVFSILGHGHYIAPPGLDGK